MLTLNGSVKKTQWGVGWFGRRLLRRGKFHSRSWEIIGHELEELRTNPFWEEELLQRKQPLNCPQLVGDSQEIHMSERKESCIEEQWEMILERFGSGHFMERGIRVELLGSILGGRWAKKPKHLHLLTDPEEDELSVLTWSTPATTAQSCVLVYICFSNITAGGQECAASQSWMQYLFQWVLPGIQGAPGGRAEIPLGWHEPDHHKALEWWARTPGFLFSKHFPADT